MVSKNKAAATVSFLLAMVVAYQIYYYSLGLLHMQGKYLGMHFWIANVFSLIPAVWLSHHTSQRLMNGAAADEKPIWKKIAYFYILTAAVELIAYIYGWMPQSHMQLAPESLMSFRKALHWWVYYFGVLVFTPAQLIAAVYLFTDRLVAKPAKTEEKSESQAALVYSQTIYEYQPTQMV